MSEFVATQWSVDVSKHLNIYSIRSEYSEHQELLPILSDWIGYTIGENNVGWHIA